jgi:chromosome condensin MukBEF ATPase and DNA-binding subunit MukB
MTNGIDRDALTREMRKVVPAPFTPRAIETAMRHIADARAEALEEAADWLTTRHIMTEAHNTLAEELRHARDRGSFLDAVAIAERHIAAARAEALGEAKNEAQRIMRLAADSGSTGAVVGAKCVRDAIRALMEPPA